GVKMIIILPLVVGGRVIGIFDVRFNAETAVGPEKLGLSQALVHQATMAIQMARLAEQGRRTAVLEERNRMAREIHDTLAQSFAGVLLQLEAARRLLAGDLGRGEAHIESARQVACQGLAEARRSVHA